ncbi:mandelate racemase/muconate lactonizing enzyme family protein [Enterovirga rhinocerotis]|uniref:Muconate cycloisomerase n=1 Tax=Enterovirga rhinocerotis TaxID=1339210 RepID=A0A4R7BZ68_9HYPH|nr:enolase C-terminal domain-like protein [Enterovirga rhinocerotis]TDR90065.1 muconate cycloisomerase [Enterovirga rhinocerotis]
MTHGSGDPSAILSIDVFPVRMPLKKPLVMSTYRIDDGPALFVRVRTRSGHEGWGEAAASPVMAGETLEGMQAAVRHLIAPHLIAESALDRARLMRRLRTSLYGNGGALAAVDIALLDLVGRIRNVPVVDLLGGVQRRTVDPLWLIGGTGSPDEVVESALALRAQGFRAFKLKVGVADLLDEIRTVALLRDALGEDCLIAADANMGWDVATALRFARASAEFGLAFLEQPVGAGDFPRMKAVGQGSPVPIGIDESMHGAHDILAHAEAGAIGGVSLKTIKLGGVAPLVALAGTCDTLGLSVNLAMMMESSLATAAMVHAACAVPRIDWGLSLGNLWLAEDPVSAPIACADGVVRCPEGPGLGVTVDERRLADLAA